MNFSNTRRFRKMLSVLFVLTLMSALLAGCFGKGGDEETTPSEPNININLSETNGTPDEQTEPTETEPVVINENSATVLSQLTIRSSPSTDATVVGTLYSGDKVEVSRRETVVGIEWAYIISPEAGWICMDFVEMDFEPEKPAEEDTSTPAGNETTPTEESKPTEPAGTTVNIKGVITGSGLNIRSEGSTKGDIIGAYNKGDVVTILETKDGWGRTNKGWINMDYVNTSGTNTNTNTNTGSNDNDTTVEIAGNGNTTVQFRGVVTAKELNVRADSSTNADVVGSYVYGDRVEFLEKDGTWGRTKKGWISLNYVYQDGATTEDSVSGYVTTDGVNIRSGPGTDYEVVGSYNENDDVTILAQFTYGKYTWGCTKKGWVRMDYVDVGDEDKDTGSSDNSSDDDDVKYGTIIAEGLRIRSGPGTEYDTVGSLQSGDEVKILDQKQDDSGTVWGMIDEGWISMKYVELD